MSDCLILGYYGFKNSGDDALILSIIRELKKCKEDIEITVLSNNPEETKRVYEVNSVSRTNILDILSQMKKCKMFVLGGGTLIQDKTSTKSLLYYLFMILLASVFKKKIMLYSNGIGPVSDKNKMITGKILNKVDLITLRDEDSKNVLNELKVNKPEVVITADCAFCIDKENEDIASIKKSIGLSENDKYICVSVRNHNDLSETFEDDIVSVCDYIYEKYGYYTVFIPFQKKNDLQITNSIKQKLKNKSFYFSVEYSINTLLNLMSQSELVIGMRLHSLIYASICNVPQIALVYDPKITGFMEYISQKNTIPVNKLNYDELKCIADECILNKKDITEELKEKSQIMKNKAKMNAELAIKLLNE